MGRSIQEVDRASDRAEAEFILLSSRENPIALPAGSNHRSRRATVRDRLVLMQFVYAA